MKCSKCGAENREGRKFCAQCGAKLGWVCPECGFENEPDERFCGGCGHQFDGGTGIPVDGGIGIPVDSGIGIPVDSGTGIPVDSGTGIPVDSGTGIPARDGITVPKLEDMQDRIYIPEPMKRRMEAAEQDIVGENRLVTALFADISGFTPMSRGLTPEATVDKVNQCFQAVTDAVYRYEGSINRFIGDCVLAFFGAPLAHENDPERAILSALDMQKAVSDLGLSISVGINTGMMYFGPIGTQEHLEISAYGTDINLAKRLQETAQPGQILVGEGTYRFTRRAFEFEHLEHLTLKGIAEPVSAYAALKLLPRPEKIRGIEG